MNWLRVCIVSTFPPCQDAVGPLTAQLALDLSRTVDVVVVANRLPQVKYDSYDRQISNGRLNITRKWEPGFLWPFTVIRELSRRKPNVIHVQHEFFLYGGSAGASLAFIFFVTCLRALRRPLITTLHHVVPRTGVHQMLRLGNLSFPRLPASIFLNLFYRSLRSVSHVIVPREALKKTLVEDYGFDPMQVTVIPHRFAPEESKIGKLDARKQLHLDADKVILFFGFIRPSKGIEILIKSLPTVRQVFPNTVLLMVGSCDRRYKNYREKVNELVISLRLERAVRWEGFVPHQRQKPYFSATDVVVFPYLSMQIESSSSLARAASFEVPIIATTVGEFGESISNRRNGILVPTQDPSSLAEAIIEVLSNSEFARKLGKGSSELAQLKQFGGIDEILSLYTNSLEGKFSTHPRGQQSN